MAGNIHAGILRAFRTLLINICEEIYRLIIFCFDIFEEFGNLRILENKIDFIFQKVGLVLGLFMIFRITFSAIEYIINPDNILDRTKGVGNIVKKTLIVVVLLGSTHFLFDYAYKIQEALINSHVIGKVLLSTSDANERSDGGDIAWSVFSAFYTPNEYASPSGDNTCISMFNDGTFEKDLTLNHNMGNASACVNMTDENDIAITPRWILDESLNGNFIIEFHGIIAIAVGLVILWIIVTYTIQLGVRAIQLAYLELIAPIPIMMYLTPNGDDKLINWGKQCLTTFLDFFIRLAIMDFIILVSTELIHSITDQSGELYATFAELTTNWAGGMYVLVIMIVALMIFAKRIPKLLGEILPSTGGVASLGFGVNLKQLGSFAGGFAGATVGGLTNGVVSGIDRANIAGTLGRNRLGAFGAGLLSGGAIGVKNGAKGGNVFKNIGAGWTARNKADRQYEKLLASGGSATGVALAKFRSNFGETPGEYLIRQMGHADKINEYQKEFFEYINNIGDVRMWADAAKEATIKEGESVEAFTARKRRYEENAQNAREAIARAVEEGRSMDDIRTNGLSYKIKELKEKTRTVKGADGVLKQEKYFDEETTDRNFNILKDDDKLYSGASASIAGANSYITSHHVKIHGESGVKDMPTIGSGPGQQSVKEAGKAANESKKNISKSAQYQREKANNEAAGISK